MSLQRTWIRWCFPYLLPPIKYGPLSKSSLELLHSWLIGERVEMPGFQSEMTASRFSSMLMRELLLSVGYTLLHLPFSAIWTPMSSQSPSHSSFCRTHIPPLFQLLCRLLLRLSRLLVCFLTQRSCCQNNTSSPVCITWATHSLTSQLPLQESDS